MFLGPIFVETLVFSHYLASKVIQEDFIQPTNRKRIQWMVCTNSEGGILHFTHIPQNRMKSYGPM